MLLDVLVIYNIRVVNYLASFHEVISCSTETCHLLRLESMTYLCRNR